MEHRLVHQKAPERMRGPELQDLERAEVQEEIMQELSTVQEDVETPLIQEDIRLGMDATALEAKANQSFATDLPQHLNQTIDYYGPRIVSIQDNLFEGLKGDGNFAEEVREITQALTSPLPLDAAAQDLEHRYVQMTHDEEHENIPDWYGVDFRKIDADRAMLTTLSAAHPELREELALLDNALEDFSNQDQRKALYVVEKRQANNRTDQTIMEMGKISIFIIAALMAVGTGIIAWRTGKSMRGPLLLAALAGLIANPTLRRKLLSSQDQNALTEIDSTLNDADFKILAKHYDIAGPNWKSFTEQLMEDPSDTKTFIKELARYEDDPSPMAKEIEEYVKDAFPAAAAQERASLTQMIYDNQFRDFAERMMRVKEEQAQETVLDYIAAGSARFEQNVQVAAKKTNKAARFPQGGTLGMR